MDKALRAAITETILSYAVNENFKREMAAIPPDSELAKIYVFSERHEKRMKSLFANERRKEITVKVLIKFKFVALVGLVSIAVLFGSLLTSQNVRAAVGRTMIEWYDQFTRFSYEGTNTPDEFMDWYPLYIPDGFEESEITDFGDNMKQIRYVSQENGTTIFFEYSQTEGATISIDNEHSVYEPIFIDGIDYQIFRAMSDEYRNKILWRMDGDYRFYLASTIHIDEMIKMAVSVTKK